MQKKDALCHCGSYEDAYRIARKAVGEMFTASNNDEGPCGIFNIAVASAIIQLCAQVSAKIKVDDGGDNDEVYAEIGKMVNDINREMGEYMKRLGNDMGHDVVAIMEQASRHDATLN